MPPGVTRSQRNCSWGRKRRVSTTSQRVAARPSIQATARRRFSSTRKWRTAVTTTTTTTIVVASTKAPRPAYSAALSMLREKK